MGDLIFETMDTEESPTESTFTEEPPDCVSLSDIPTHTGPLYFYRWKKHKRVSRAVGQFRTFFEKHNAPIVCTFLLLFAILLVIAICTTPSYSIDSHRTETVVHLQPSGWFWSPATSNDTEDACYYMSNQNETVNNYEEAEYACSYLYRNVSLLKFGSNKEVELFRQMEKYVPKSVYYFVSGEKSPGVDYGHRISYILTSDSWNHSGFTFRWICKSYSSICPPPTVDATFHSLPGSGDRERTEPVTPS